MTQTDISREAVELLPCKLCGGGFTSYHAFGEQVWQHVGLANCLLKGHVLKIGSLMATWNRFMSSEAQSQRIAELEGALSAAQTDRAQMYDALTLSLSKGVEMKAQLSAAREAEHDANGVADANIKRADSAEAQLTTIAAKAAKAMQEEAARELDWISERGAAAIRAINVDAIVEKARE